MKKLILIIILSYSFVGSIYFIFNTDKKFLTLHEETAKTQNILTTEVRQKTQKETRNFLEIKEQIGDRFTTAECRKNPACLQKARKARDSVIKGYLNSQ